MVWFIIVCLPSFMRYISGSDIIISSPGHTATETTEKFYYFNAQNLDETKELLYNALC